MPDNLYQISIAVDIWRKKAQRVRNKGARLDAIFLPVFSFGAKTKAKQGACMFVLIPSD